MTDPADAIAEKLIEAAYELFGRPPEAGGEYIHTVVRETDVPAYFRHVLGALRVGPPGRPAAALVRTLIYALRLLPSYSAITVFLLDGRPKRSSNAAGGRLRFEQA